MPDPVLRHALLVRDAVNFWAGGLLARTGHIATLFDPHAYWPATQTLFGADFPLHTWSYPPPMLLIGVPLSMLPVLSAYLAWNALGTASLWVAARAADLPGIAASVAVASPAALESLLAGQTGALCAALAVPGLVLLEQRPALAGALLGLLVFKPQMLVLVPVCLAASRNGRGALAATASALAVLLVSTLLFGWASWSGFLFQVLPFMRHVILEAPWHGLAYQPMIATPFIALRYAGAPLIVAYAGQSATALLAATLCWKAWRHSGADPLARAALTLALGFLATPYGYSYDMPALSAALIGLALRNGPWQGRARLAFAMAWIWPGCGYWAGVLRLPPLGLLAVIAAILLAYAALGATPRLAQPSQRAAGIRPAAASP